MSRSRRRTPVMPLTTAKSDKPYKVDEHRSFRRTCRTLIASQRYDELPHPIHYGDPWLAPKDGKQWIDPHSKWMRK